MSGDLARASIHRLRRPARGVTLVIALVMLAALGLIAAAAMRSGTANVRIVDNTQSRQAAFMAAQAAIESTISAPTFTQQPAAVAANPVTVDLDGDGAADLSATLSPAPACYRWKVIKVSELDAASAGDRACLGSGAVANSGIDGGTSGAGDSLCANSEWNVRAVVVDATTGADVRVNQGVQVRSLITDVTNNCP
jgi:Tfp pilus assembly protein PilV